MWVQGQHTVNDSDNALEDQLRVVDPWLADSVSNVQLSPRIAVVCLTHQLADVARGAPEGTSHSTNDAADASKTSL